MKIGRRGWKLNLTQLLTAGAGRQSMYIGRQPAWIAFCNVMIPSLNSPHLQIGTKRTQGVDGVEWGAGHIQLTFARQGVHQIHEDAVSLRGT